MKQATINRKAYKQLLDWKQRLADKYALLIEGARRVGKTYLIQSFIQREYESSIYIDFSSKNKLTTSVKKAFIEESDVKTLLEHLSIIYGVRLIPGNSCIVFDEIQRFPQAREMIKSFMAYGKYHYIESGSLVGIKENTKDIVIPSEEHSLKLYPLDFEEFMEASEETLLLDAIHNAFAQKTALRKEYHAKALRLFRTYMVVGGMPQSMSAYLQGDEHRLEDSELAKREILSLYNKDIGKYASSYASKVRSLFKHIPSALNSREKRFHLADLDTNARTRRYENAFLWLTDAMLVNLAYNSESPDIGLEMNLENTLLKAYSLDTGLLITQAMTGSPEVDSRLLRGVLYDNLGINEGMFFENAVAQALAANGNELFFYSLKDSKTPSATMEIDFLLRDGIKICPIEVKSAQYRRHISLDRFMVQFRKKTGQPYVICRGNLEISDNIIYIPIYMTHLLGIHH